MSAPHARSEPTGIAEPLVEAVSAFRRSVRRAAGRPWPTADLTGSQAELVRLVRREPGIPVSAAAQRLTLAGNTVSTLVRRLVDAGLLQRTVDPGDRRVARLTVTPAARRRIEGWRDRRIDRVTEGLAVLDPGERAALKAAIPALDRLAGVLQDLEEET
ncbi:MAG: MarR family winged helix-turn-helix transcriptional regulator [Blastococcus sp.]